MASLWMIGATAYDIPLLGGQNVPRIVDSAIERPMQEADACASLEHRDGNWLLNTPMHVCQQTGCLACFLAQIRCMEYCPWYNPDHFDNWHIVNFICVQGPTDTIIRVIGQSKFWIYHVVNRDDLTHFISCSGYTAFAAEVLIFRSHLNAAPITTQQLQQNFAFMENSYLPLQVYRHFFIRIGGTQDQFNDWLLRRSQAFRENG